MSYQQVVIRRALEGEPVSRFMRTDPVTVRPEMDLRDVVEHFVYRHQHKMYPVLDGERVVGCVTLSAIRSVPQDEWPQTQVRNVMRGCSSENTVTPDTDAMAALSLLNRTESSRLMVVEGDRIVGVLALKDLMGWLSMKIEMEGDA
jgi:predicted transcriptional regulator